MDKALVELARGPDAPEQAASVSLILPNMLVGGQVCSESDFDQRFREAHLQASFESLGRKHKTEQARSEIWDHINRVFSRVSGALRSDTAPDGLCLLNASVFLWTGETMHVPCLRIPLEQIVGWYAGIPRFDKAGSGGGWFVGGLFPVGD